MDKALKQRLVGASVLVALAVIILPMLLSGQPENQPESRRIELPDRPPELSMETRRFPIGDQDPNQPSRLERPPPARLDDGAGDAMQEVPSGAETGPEDATMHGDAGPGPAATQSEPAAIQAASAPDTVPASELALTASESPDAAGRYLVQVASFSTVANANRLAGRLRDGGLPVLLDTVDAAAGRLHRVRIGPYTESAEAEQAMTALNREFPDLSPRIMDLRPEESAPVSDPTDPLIRWIVQVGVFSQSTNAENLVFRLRDAGFRASSEAVRGANGTSWRVRVGPVVERQDAVRLAADIQRDMGLDGLVMSAD